jgi:hypothetical protein
MEYYSLEEGKYPDKKKTTGDEFIGDGWSLRKDDEKFILSYVSGELQGKLKDVVISEKDYNLLVTGKISFYNISLKYDFS